MLFVQWRQNTHTIRPHSALGYRPPAPEAWQPHAAGRLRAAFGGPMVRTGMQRRRGDFVCDTSLLDPWGVPILLMARPFPPRSWKRDRETRSRGCLSQPRLPNSTTSLVRGGTCPPTRHTDDPDLATITSSHHRSSARSCCYLP